MIGYAFALIAAQTIVSPDPSAWTVDQRIAYLAESEARMANRIEGAVYADPAIRAEIRRVGFSAGCSAFGRARREVVNRHASALTPHFEAAIRRLVPLERITEAPFLSFLWSSLSAYQRRVSNAAEQSAEAELAGARADLRATFLSYTAPLATNGDPSANVVMPRTDIARALGVEGAWNLDNPNHLSMACLEQLISPDQRPIISGGGTDRPSNDLPIAVSGKPD